MAISMHESLMEVWQVAALGLVTLLRNQRMRQPRLVTLDPQVPAKLCGHVGPLIEVDDFLG